MKEMVLSDRRYSYAVQRQLGQDREPRNRQVQEERFRSLKFKIRQVMLK